MRLRKNGSREEEHPKPQVEILSNSREAIEGYMQATGLSFEQAALVLMFNEIRCIHWHYDNALAREMQAPVET